MVTERTSSKEIRLENGIYDIFHYLREGLIIILNLTGIILSLYIFPADRFSESESIKILISLTFILITIFSYYYLIICSSINRTSFYLINGLILTNLLITAIQLDVAFSLLVFGILLFYSANYVVQKKGIIDLVESRAFLHYGYATINLAYWWIQGDLLSNSLNAAEFVLSQLFVIGMIYHQRGNRLFDSSIHIPLVHSVMLLPAFTTTQIASGNNSLFDVHLLIFILYSIVLTAYLLKIRKTEVYNQIVVNMIISLVLYYGFLEFIKSPLTIEEFFGFSFSVIGVLYLEIVVLLVLGAFIDTSEERQQIYAILSQSITSFFILVQILAFNEGSIYVNQLFLSIGILISFIIFLRKDISYHIAPMFIQAVNVMFLPFMYRELNIELSSLIMIIYIGLASFSLMSQASQEIRIRWLGSIYGVINSQILFQVFIEFKAVNLSILILASVIPLMVGLVIEDNKLSSMIIAVQSASIFHFSILNFGEDRFELVFLPIDFLDLTIVIFVLVSLQIIRKSDFAYDNIVIQNISIQVLIVALTISVRVNYLIYGRMVNLPNLYVMALAFLSLNVLQIMIQKRQTDDVTMLSQILPLIGMSLVISSEPYSTVIITVLYLVHIMVPVIKGFKASLPALNYQGSISNIVLISFFAFLTQIKTNNIAYPHEFAIIFVIIISAIFIGFDYIADFQDRGFGLTLGALVPFGWYNATYTFEVSALKVGSIINFEKVKDVSSFTLAYIVICALLIIRMRVMMKNNEFKKVLEFTGVVLAIIAFIQLLEGYTYPIPVSVFMLGILGILVGYFLAVDEITLSQEVFAGIFTALYLINIQIFQVVLLIGGNYFHLGGFIYIGILSLFLLFIKKMAISTKRYAVFAILIYSVLISPLIANDQAMFPYEFLLVSFIIAFIIIKDVYVEEKNSRYLIIYLLAAFLITMINPDIAMIDYSYDGFTMNPQVLFVLVGLVYVYIQSKSEGKTLFENLIIFSIYFVIASLTYGDIIHPAAFVAVIFLSILPLYNIQNREARYYLPVSQAIMILAFTLRQDTIVIGSSEYEIFNLVYLIWTVTLLGLWYSNGTENQLIGTITSIFLVASGLSLYSRILTSQDYTFDALLVLVPMVIATLFVIAFYSRIRSAYDTTYLTLLITIGLTLIFYAQAVQSLYSGTEELFIRLVVDWLIFIPIISEVIIYTRPKIDVLSSQGKEDLAEKAVMGMFASFLLVSILMGAEGVFSLKLLALGIGSWLFAIVIVREKLSWFASVVSIFIFGFIVAQADSGGESFTEYFLLLAFFGVIMSILGLVNERKWKGEPITASLLVSGSILTAMAVLAPLLLDDSFPLVNEEFGKQIVNFIPNIVWAIQGLALFVISTNLSKEYLKRLSLSILLIDIVKTGFNLWSEADNPLIRIFGAMALGAILILIFFLFTKEDEDSESNKTTENI